MRSLADTSHVIAMLAAASSVLPLFAAQTPTFSTKTEAVYVAATVIDQAGRLVTGLTKDDFEIRESGTLREITVFRNDRVPFAIVIMLDVSGSMFGNLGLMRRGVDQLISRFEPGDRASIGTFQGLPMITPRFTANPQRLLESVSAAMGGMGTPCTGTLEPQGGSAVWAAIKCGIEHVASDAETPRRAVMVVTDAMDNASGFVTPTDLKKLADQYGIMVYGVGMYGSEGINSVTLRDLAEHTGGGYFQLKDFDEVVPAFARVAEELRHQYVFGFTPMSADDRKLDLKVRALQGETNTRWRRVYLQAAPVFTSAVGSPGGTPSTGSGTEPPPTPTASKTDALTGRAVLLDALDRYEHAEWQDILTESTTPGARTLGDLLHAVPDWVEARGAEHEPRRRLAAATYIIELLEKHARGAATWQERQPASTALEFACTLLRQGPPLPSEMWWHTATIGLLERAGATAPLIRHLEHLEARFPREPGWTLARAVAEELTVWQFLHDDRAIQIRRQTADRMTAAFSRASLPDLTRAEAHVRWGYVELRLDHIDEALTHFNQAGNPGDPYVRYWLHLFKGQALQRADRIKEAIASYEIAMSVVPYAQSAAFSLGAALVEDRRPSEAAALMIRVLAVQPAVQDPWTGYLAPEMRFWPPLIQQLRRAIVQ